MNSVEAFNNLMIQFLTDLCETFPDCIQMAVTLDLAKTMIADEQDSVMHKFVDEIEPFSQQLTQMDESFFLNSDIDFLQLVGVGQYWTPQLEPETKEAIWQYLQSLFALGSAIRNVPPEMLATIEQFAQQFSEKIDAGQIDPSKMSFDQLSQIGMTAVQGMVSDPNQQQQQMNWTPQQQQQLFQQMQQQFPMVAPQQQGFQYMTTTPNANVQFTGPAWPPQQQQQQPYLQQQQPWPPQYYNNNPQNRRQ